MNTQELDIESLEIKLLKSSQIEDGDIILVKINEEDEKKISKENVRKLYDQISDMVKKPNIGIYFFPKNLDISLIKNLIKENTVENLIEKENTNDEN